MEARIEVLQGKKLVGKRMHMCMRENRTGDLWRAFMQERKLIGNAVGSELISMQVYDKGVDFAVFNPDTVFEKWAAVEVRDFDAVPEGMESFELEGGLYAVFVHKGAAETGAKTFGYIFGSWVPQSGYMVDSRPQFEVLEDKYRNNDPESEEEIWIPIRR